MKKTLLISLFSLSIFTYSCGEPKVDEALVEETLNLSNEISDMDMQLEELTASEGEFDQALNDLGDLTE